MKTSKLLTVILGLLISTTVYSQTIYPDALDEPLSDAMMFVKNEGQLTSETQWLADVIQYYTWASPGMMYFTTSNFFSSGIVPARSGSDPDTIHRMDFAFSNGANQVDPVLLQANSVNLKYYQQNGTFTSVASGKRIIYEDLYTDIDVHFYSNEYGPKTSIVFENGANPLNFEMQVSGYDQITQVLNYLIIHKAGYSYVIPEGIAYQIDGGNVNLLSWQPKYTHDGNGKLSFNNIGSYDPNKPLIFQFGYTGLTRAEDPEYVDWCTLFGGGNSRSKVYDLETDASDNLYVGGYTSSQTFPASNTAYQDTLSGERDFFFARFTPGRAIDWATFIGGSKKDDAANEPFHFALKSDNSLLVAASVTSLDFPMIDPGGGAYFNDTNDCSDPSQGCWDGVIMEITDTGSLIYSTYFGNFGDKERLWAVSVDANDNYFVVGRGNYPYKTLSGAYNATALGVRGQVTKFNNNRGLVWSTAFGTGQCHIYDCALDQNGKLLITGYANGSGSLPTKNLTGAYNDASHNGGYDGFVAQFDANLDREWVTYLGGNGGDRLWSIDVSEDNEILVGGETYSSSGIPLGGGVFLQDTVGGDGSYEDLSDAYFARFDSSRDTVQCSYFGGWGNDNFRDVAFYGSHVFGIGATESTSQLGMPFPGFTPPGLYVDDQHDDGLDVWPDGYIMALRGEDHSLMWTNFVGTFGGFSSAEDEGLTSVYIKNDKVFVGGYMSGQVGLPYQNPGSGAWFQSTTSASPNAQGAICVFDIAQSPLPVEEIPISISKEAISIYPNPFTEQVAITHDLADPLSVSLFDMQGRQVLTPQAYSAPLQLGYLQPGTYLFRAESGTNSYTTLIVKQ